MSLPYCEKDFKISPCIGKYLALDAKERTDVSGCVFFPSGYSSNHAFNCSKVITASIESTFSYCSENFPIHGPAKTIKESLLYSL